MRNKLEVNEENVLCAYKNANIEQKSLLEALFGKGLFNQKDITERVKTFEDACDELGKDHPLVMEYWGVCGVELDIAKDLIAYLKLRIIVAALNEGWEPQFTENERRYFPWFYTYTPEKYYELDEEKKRRCVIRPIRRANTYYAIMFSDAFEDASYSYINNGSQLALKSQKLAKYAANQFAEIWADFIFEPKD